MPYTNDPVEDYGRYSDKQEMEMERLPVCCHCTKHIDDDFLYYIEGDLWCEECMKDEFRKPTDDFIE